MRTNFHQYFYMRNCLAEMKNAKMHTTYHRTSTYDNALYRTSAYPQGLLSKISIYLVRRQLMQLFIIHRKGILDDVIIQIPAISTS